MLDGTKATLSELAEELNRADIALSIGMSRKEERKWVKYRRDVMREIDRRDPVPPEMASMTDAELLAALQ